MFAQVNALREELETVVEDLDTDGLDGPRAARLLADFAAIERLGANAKTLVARRLDETRGWRAEGDRSFAHYVARKTGTSLGQATDTVKTAQRLDPWGAPVDAMKTGEVSAQQASVIAEACAADPDAETGLLTTAANDGVEGLRAECRRVKAAASDDPLTRHREIHRRRRADGYPDAYGAFRIESSMTPEAGPPCGRASWLTRTSSPATRRRRACPSSPPPRTGPTHLLRWLAPAAKERRYARS